MATLSLRHVRKVYDKTVKAVQDFNLEIADREFIVLVGPSGCGKSTTLRMVAGLRRSPAERSTLETGWSTSCRRRIGISPWYSRTMPFTRI